jgi:hypothetical protein
MLLIPKKDVSCPKQGLEIPNAIRPPKRETSDAVWTHLGVYGHFDP